MLYQNLAGEKRHYFIILKACFLTVFTFAPSKKKMEKNDKASDLSRKDVFRLAIGLPKKTYISLFGEKPTRPAKGNVVSTGHDFTLLNELMPHPVYAWMGWVQVLSPTEETFEQVLPLLKEAHSASINKFRKR